MVSSAASSAPAVAVSGPLPDSLYVGSVVGAVLLVLALLYTERPPVTRQTVLALTPWMVVAPTLHVLAALGSYPAVIQPLLRGPSAYATAFVVAGLAWTSLAQFARIRLNTAALPQYLAAMGVGMVTVVLPYVIWQGSFDALELAVFLGVPFVAAAVAAGSYFLLSLWSANAAAYTGLVGGLVIYGHTLDALAAAAGIRVLGRTASVSVPGLATALSGGASLVGVVDDIWLFVAGRVLLAVALVALFATYTRDRPTRGYLILGFFAAVGVVSGVQTLLAITVG